MASFKSTLINTSGIYVSRQEDRCMYGMLGAARVMEMNSYVY